MNKPRRKVGDIVITVDDIHWPELIKAGTEGRIIAVGPDAVHGWYKVEFPDVPIFLAPIFPAPMSHIRVKGE